MVEFSPDALAHRSFRTTLRGFDQTEVRDFLAELGAMLAGLIAERDQLAATLQAGDVVDLKREIEVVSGEVHSVLEAARSAAETMRERAAAETATWRAEAIADAESARRDAHADAEHLRTDAWTTSETLLSQAQREAAGLRAEAEKEAMRLVGESERDAHRHIGAGRREAEETVRTARMEAERIVLEARASHDEIIETATRKAEIAQERTRALEERKDELRRELDSLRAAIASVESELDERREALSLSEVAAEPPAREVRGEWVPGETVRVVRPGPHETRTDDLPVISEPRPLPDPTPELRVLTPQELRSRQDPERSTTPVPTEVSADDASIASVEVEEDQSIDGEVSQPAADEPSAKEPEEPEPAAPALQEVEGLFARLREPISTETAAPASTPAASGAASSPSVSVSTLDVDPFEMRDELLLPIANRALRNVKRQLTEEQNAALEAIRIDASAWSPDTDALEASLRPDLVVLSAESFAAGHAAAERLTATKLGRPATPSDSPSPGFAASLASDLDRAMADGRAHEYGARQLASDVSRVFRAWRTDESERRMRHLSLMAFNRGLVESLEAAGSAGVRWIVAGRGCAICRDLAGRDPVEDPPPAHEGCTCTVVPV
ncbi:MAG TPA: DivIVA domain-containing protein [Acidimicrobiia bacterium]|nr:DivIVA domain-containing protein [Acidimicrobiia bacterium]